MGEIFVESVRMAHVLNDRAKSVTEKELRSRTDLLAKLESAKFALRGIAGRSEPRFMEVLDKIGEVVNVVDQV
jgi:hypothetical protein